jgi:short-subunit dehydrogenase
MSPRDASVVLTGAAGGLGSAIARRLFDEGASLLLVGRSEAPLLALAQSLSAGARDRARVDALVVDVTTDAGRNAVSDAAGARSANVLINNAALAAFGPAQSLQTEALRQLMDTNVVAPMMLTASLLPLLLAQPRAHVLNIGSTLGSLGVPGFSAYAASKAALRMYSEALRRELADSCVRVQYYAPRAIDTPFNSAEVLAFNKETDSASDSPEEIAQAVSRMLQSESRQRFAGGIESVAARLNGLCPEWFDGAFAKHRRALMSLKSSTGAQS